MRFLGQVKIFDNDDFNVLLIVFVVSPGGISVYGLETHQNSIGINKYCKLFLNESLCVTRYF